MTLGTYDVQTAGSDNLIMQLLPFALDGFNLLVSRVFQFAQLSLPVTTQHNVGTTTSHVGGNGNSARATGLSHDIGFHCVELGIQHLVLDALLVQHVGDQLGVLDGDGTHQHRAPFGDAILDVLDDRRILLFGGQINQVTGILTHHGTVGWQHHGIETIDLLELEGFGIRSTRHTCQLLVNTEVVLEGDRGHGLVFVLDLHPFLGFDGLMQTFGPATASHGATCVFIDDNDLVILDDVIHVALKQGMRPQRRIDVVQQGDVGGGEERVLFAQQAILFQQLFDKDLSGFGQQGLTGLLVNCVMTVTAILFAIFLILLLQQGNQLVDLNVEGRAIFGGPGDDQRSPRFIDEDRVDFIHQRIVERTLHTLIRRKSHVVTQIVETKFVVGPVGDVSGIGSLLLGVVHARQIAADRQTEEFKQWAVPLGITLGQIVVDRDDMDTSSGQCIQVSRQSRGQGLAFTGLHFSDLVVVQHHAAHQLDVKMAHAEHTLGGFANGGEGFGQQLL